MMVSWVSKFRIFRGQQVSWNNIFYTAIVDHDIPGVYQLWDGLDQVRRQSLSQSISGGVELACILSSADYLLGAFGTEILQHPLKVLFMWIENDNHKFTESIQKTFTRYCLELKVEEEMNNDQHQVDMEGVVLPLVLADNLSGYVEEWKFIQLWRRQWWWWQQNAVRQVCTPMGVLHQAIATNVDKVVSVKEEVKVGDYGGSSSDGDGSQGEEVVIGAFTE
ncbi:unnamed protein product [Sphagnum troendelagicum]|uniref:Uncharacterized protein n=1 Tax=Sphagnum troendelagicum TaxID=128251 RepID=A0ABP0TJB1_9BRYO